ncbi:hypothetical protein FRX31_008335 [Thalictrum thalictroides]|uniref:Uncharacterized protein n=1 Tax=Thalictrum thalictroides TaxID=46969 RepID=A0A7J6X0Z0_THATH|nr:hypothetical protein FRX31_008335 [Thalictrum thalictroides]
MTDYKPQGKSRQGPKVVGEREFTYNGSDVHSNGMSEVGFPKGYQDHISSPVLTHTDGKVKPLYGSSTDGDFVTKTETIVEYVRVPMVTTQGNSSPSIIAPVGTTPVPSHNQAPKVQTDTGRPYKTISNLYWWCKPNSNAIVGIYDSGLPAANTGLNNYTRLQDSGKLHQHYDTPLGRNMVPNGKESTVTTTDGRAMSTSSKEAPPKGIPLTKPTNIVETDHFKDATVLVARPQAHVLPPVVSQANVSLPTIDSREAERRYGGLLTFPAEAYVPAIDSREAAWKYRGQML